MTKTRPNPVAWWIAGLLFLLAAPPQAEAVDICALEDASVIALGGDGLGGTGASGDDGVGGTGVETDGIGGTGIAGTGPDGLGGTGIAGTGPDGLGGTGIAGTGPDGLGGTGIYGTLTRFGSLCVNGLRVRVDDDTVYAKNGQATDSSAIAVGQVLWIEADAGEKALMARQVTAYSAVVGAVSHVEADGNRFEVEGQRVRVAPGVQWRGVTGMPIDSVSVGTRVDVSGLRDDRGAIVASRLQVVGDQALDFEGPRLEDLVQAAPQLQNLSIEGYLGAPGPGGVFRVSGLEVESASLVALREDTQVWLSGTLSGADIMKVDRAKFRPLAIPEVRPFESREIERTIPRTPPSSKRLLPGKPGLSKLTPVQKPTTMGELDILVDDDIIDDLLEMPHDTSVEKIPNTSLGTTSVELDMPQVKLSTPVKEAPKSKPGPDPKVIGPIK